METKSDITDPASVMKQEGEGKELTSESWDITVNQFPPEEMNKAEPWVNQPPDAITFLEKSEDIPVAINIEVENVDAFIKGNFGTLEGENFLRSLSVANVTCEKTSILADDCQAAEILNQAEKLVPKNETIWEEKLEDQHVEIVANEEASPEENHQNTKEELGGSQKDEKGVMISDEKSETEYNTQTPEMLEATYGQNAEACDREESTENALGSNTASIEEGLREVSFQEEGKESETSFNSVGKEMDAEAIQLSTITEDNKNEGQEKPHDSTNDVCIPETASPDNEEEKIENSMGAKDNTGRPLVTALIDERSSQNAGLDVGGNLEENPSITFEERSKETVKSIEKKQLTSTEDDICKKSNLETSSENKMEDMCFQRVDKPEIFKEASEIGSEDIVKESQNELQNQSGIAKVDGSFMKLEGSIHREGEAMAPTEALTREYSNDEGFTVVVGKNNVEVEEHSRSEISKHEGHQQQSLLKSEPGKGNPESPPLDAASEEIETTTSDEHAETITHVEDQIDSLEETMKCKTLNADDVNNEEIQEEKTLSTVDLDEKPVSAEVEIPNKNANYLNVTHPLVEETTEVGGEQQDKVSTTEFEGQVLEADRLPTEEEKHANEAYEISRSAECSILERTSTEEAPATELTTEASEMEVDNFERVYRLNSEEKLQVVDAGDNIIEEIQHKEEASDTESQRITGKSDATKKSAMKEEVSVKDSNTIGTGEEADQLNCRGDENERNNSEETTSEMNGGDQSCRTDNEMGNIYDRIINEEVYEGPKIAEMEEGTEKKIKYEECAVTDHSTESTSEEKTKHFQEDEAEAEKSRAEMEKEHETTMADEGKGIKEQAVLEKNRIQDQPMVSTEEETNAEGSKEDEMMAAMPKQEVLDTTNTGKDFLEHIVKEVGATNDHSIGSFEEITIQESSQEDEAKEGFETAGTSTNTERQNIEESVIIDHPTITVGEEKFEEVKVLNKECIEQNLEATHPIEETKLEATKDEADANKDCYAQNTTGMSEEETMPNESNRDLIENFSIPEPDMSEKEIKEEILDKAESTKETSLKESEAEDMQVDSSDLGSEEKNQASDHPTLIVGEEKAEEQGKEMNIESIEQNLEVTHSKEEAELATKDEAETNKDYYAQSTTGTSEEETMPNDGNKDLIDNPSVPEPEVSQKEIKEEILEKRESTEEISSKEAKAEYKMQVDSSDLAYEETNMASDHPTLTVGEEKVEEQVKELNIGCIEQNLEATHPVEETKLVATKDEVDPNKDYYAQSTSGTSEEETMPNECNRDIIENSSVTKPEVSKKEILERAESTEETSSKEAETEYKMQVDSSDLASDETNLASDHPTLIIGEEKFEEQVKELSTECIEQKLEATHPTEETKLDATKDEAEPNKYCYAQNTTVRSEDEAMPNEGNRNLIANYSIPEPEYEYEVSEKEIREEILEKVESTEGTSLKEAEREYKVHVDSSHLPSEQKVLVTTETSETGSDGVDITAKPTETSKLGGNQDMENITVRKHETGGAGENMEHHAQSETHFTMSQREDQREVATGETPLDDILEPSLKASSTLSLKEHNLVTTKMSETTHETLEKDGASYVKAETSLVVEVSEEKLMQREEMSTNPRDDADMRSEDIGKESENEVVQDKDQELFMPPQVDNEKSIFESDEKLGSEIGKLETLQDDKSLDIGLEMDKPEDVKPVDEASECAEACGTCANTEKDILEKEHSVNNFEGSLKEGVEIEKAISESEAGGQSHGSEAESTATQENLESVEPAEGFKCAPDSLPEDQSNKTFPQNKTKIEEESDNIKEQNTDSTEEQIIGQDFQECKKMDEEMEPKLEAGDQINNTHDENVTLKDMILNEKVPEEVEKADKTENIKEQIIEEESCTKELHTLSKVEEQDLEPNRNLEATYSNMDTETLNSKVVEDLNWEAEASSMTKSLEEEEKKAIQKPVDVTSLISEVFSRRNQIDSTLTVVTEETSLGEVQQDKFVKAFDTSMDTKGPETIETTDTSPQGEEVFGMVSQLPKIEDGNAPEKTVNLRKPDADANILEVEQTKTSDVLSDSKCQCVEEIHETGTSLIAGMTDTDEIKEEIKEGPETISKPKCEAEKIAEQLQMPAFALPEIDSRKLEETSGMMPQNQTIEPENGAIESVIVEKLDADEVEETDSFDALHESKDLGVKEIHDSETSPAVRKIDSEKLEELLNEVPETISESRYQGVEAVTDGETPPDQTLPAVRLEEQLQVSPTALLSKEQDHVTTTTIQKIEDETEVDSIKLEETSGIVSQLPTTEWENVDSVSVTVDKLDANDIEVEETKASDAECKTKDWGVEIHETGTSPAMGKTDTDEMEEEIKEVPETISEPKYQSVEAITDKKIALDQTLPANKLEDQLQVPSHDLLSREHDYGTKTITEKVGDESTNKDETEVNSTKLEETSVMVSQLPTLQRENVDGVNVTVAKLNVDDIEVEETISSDVVCESKDQEGIEEIQETGTSPAVGKTDKDEIKEEIKEFPKKISEPIDTEEIQETKISDALCESEDQGVEEIQETGTSPAVGKTDKDEMKEEIKEFPKTISEPIDIEEIEETNISEALSKSEDKGVEESHETCTSPTVGKTDREKKEGEIKEVPETVSEPRYQGVEAVTDGESILDPTLPAGISEEKLHVQSPLLSREQDHETTTITEKMGESTKKDETEVESMKLEETYAIMSRLPTIEQENDKVVIVEKLDPDEVEETKILETLCESKDRGIEEIHETGTSSTVGKICTDEMEEKIKEVPQAISEPGYQAVEAVPYGETTPDQTLPAGILEEKLQVSSSTLLSEQDDEIKTAIEKIKDESTNKDDNQVNKNLINSFATSITEETCLQKEELRELEVSKAELKLIEGIQKESPNEASEEKSTALEKNSAIEPQEYAPGIKYADSPSECEERPIQCNSPGTSKDENILDSGNSVEEVDNLPIPHSTVKENLPRDVDKKCEESFNIEFEKTGKVLPSASDVDSPEVFPEETTIKEKKLKAAITELRAKEDQNEEMNEANKTMKNENSSEEITEERDVAKDSHLVSPNEEIVAKCKDELKTEEYPGPGEKINETTEITNGIPYEELPQELEKTGVYKNIKETGDDRTVKVRHQVSVEDGAATENLPEEAEEGKKVEKASIEFNLGNQSAETKCRDTVTAAMAPSEEGSTEVNSQVTKHFTEERELMVSKQELQMENAETAQVEEAKTDEEEEREEHKKEDSGSDAPVMVEASRDMDVKIAHKKSHSLLSGVGSKVKHSIAKVKKAIIGKSAHSKLPK